MISSWEIKDSANRLDFLGKLDGFLNAASVPVTAIRLNSIFPLTIQLFLVHKQGFLLNLLSRIGHVALTRLFYTNYNADISTLDKDFLELTSVLFVLQSIDGKDLLFVCLGQSQNISNRLEFLLELALIKQDKDT